MTVYYYMLHSTGGAFGVQDCAWPIVQAIVHGKAASFKKADSVPHGRVLLRAAARERGRADVLAQLDREDAENHRAARLKEAARLSAEFKSKQEFAAQQAKAEETAARKAREQAQALERAERERAEADAHVARALRDQRDAEQRAAREREEQQRALALVSFRERHAQVASRTIVAAAVQLARAASLPRSTSVAEGAKPLSTLEPESSSTLFVSSSPVVAGKGLACCIIFFTQKRILWVNTFTLSHGSHAQVQMHALISGLKEASRREMPSVDVLLGHATLGLMISGNIKPEPKLRRLINHLSTFSTVSFKLVSQQPSQPITEMALKLLSIAHEPAKTVGLKRVRTL